MKASARNRLFENPIEPYMCNGVIDGAAGGVWVALPPLLAIFPFYRVRFYKGPWRFAKPVRIPMALWGLWKVVWPGVVVRTAKSVSSPSIGLGVAQHLISAGGIPALIIPRSRT